MNPRKGVYATEVQLADALLAVAVEALVAWETINGREVPASSGLLDHLVARARRVNIAVDAPVSISSVAGAASRWFDASIVTSGPGELLLERVGHDRCRDVRLVVRLPGGC